MARLTGDAMTSPPPSPNTAERAVEVAKERMISELNAYSVILAAVCCAIITYITFRRNGT